MADRLGVRERWRLLAAERDVAQALLAVAPDNEWSRRVVLGNGGVPDGRNADGEDRFLLPPV